jgi:DNA polymerase-3 subunit epsilon
MINNALILDVETQGLDPATDRVIEVGMILYSITHATVVACMSGLVHADENPAEAINRIPAAALRDEPIESGLWDAVEAMMRNADCVVAHSCEFDRSFLPPALRDVRPWVCSKNDIAWPKQTRPGPSLVALALEHDLGVAVAHRALADCDLIARLFTRSRELGADLQAMLERAMRPKAEFVALVSFEEKDKAKLAGFAWQAETKTWRRRMAREDAAQLGFKVREVA